jgi:undecaprenyl-diphosphatase
VNELSYFQATLLGLLQGVTEFLPISSSGHLALVQRVMDLDPDSQRMILFDLAVHVGTLVAVAAVFAGQFRLFFKRLRLELSTRFAGRRVAWVVVALGVTASIPTAVIGLLFKDQLEAAFAKPMWIGCALLFTGTLLWSTSKFPRPRRGWRRFGFGRAFLIGLGQGVAIMPGVSRSGTTISLAMLLGIRGVWAGQFSFFIAMPAICGAALLQAGDAFGEAGAEAMKLFNGPLLVGTIAATLTGYAALRLLMVAVRRAKLYYFSYYCWLLGLVVLTTLR